MIEPSESPLAAPMRFGLRAAPFIDAAEHEAFFFPSDQHLRALEFMGHSLWTRARLGVVTADHGCGKSLLIRRFLDDLDERIVAAVVQREQMNAPTFLLEVLRQFGFPLEESDKSDRRRLLERFLTHQAGLGRICLLIVENPQSMSPGVLEELRCLSTLQVEGARVLKMLLLGQPTLDLVLQSPRMQELEADRAPRFSLSALSEDQTAAYVAHRLRAAGAVDADALMPAALMPQIHACSRGVPALINRLCDKALTVAAEACALEVTSQALDVAIEALGWSARRITAHEPEQRDPMQAEQAPPRLVISMQGMPDREFRLTGSRVLVGRGEEADVRIDSVFVSRYHALIVHDGRQHLLLDLGSTNGLLVNSRRIVRRGLRHRDIVQIGPARVMYFNEQLTQAPTIDPGETVCFARPGFPSAGTEDAGAALLAFGRAEGSLR